MKNAGLIARCPCFGVLRTRNVPELPPEEPVEPPEEPEQEQEQQSFTLVVGHGSSSSAMLTKSDDYTIT